MKKVVVLLVLFVFVAGVSASFACATCGCSGGKGLMKESHMHEDDAGKKVEEGKEAADGKKTAAEKKTAVMKKDGKEVMEEKGSTMKQEAEGKKK